MALPKVLRMKGPNGEMIDVPVPGYGTARDDYAGWGKDGECKRSVLKALEVGYRHIDCAWIYGSEGEVGAAIRESGISRNELFITSKFWCQYAAPENISKALDISLKALGLEYLDLFLAHWPVAWQAESNRKPDDSQSQECREARSSGLEDELTYKLHLEHCPADIAALYGVKGSFVPSWIAMTKLTYSGKCRAVGVSNWSIAQLQELLPHSLEVPISCNQVEMNPLFPNDELLAFMKENNILPTAYSPMAGEKTTGVTLPKDETVQRVATRNNLGIEQVLLSWAVMRGTIPIGRTSNPQRMQRALQLEGLAEKDFEALNQIQKQPYAGRTVDASPTFGIQIFPPGKYRNKAHTDGSDIISTWNLTKFPPVLGIRNIMLTGGNGFVGFWLARALLDTYSDSYNIISFDCLDFSASPQHKRMSQRYPNYLTFQGDIASSTDVQSCLSKHSVDAIIHLAANSNMAASSRDPYAFSSSNIHGTHVLLENAKVHKVKRFVFMSSVEAYGSTQPSQHGQHVENEPLAPTNPYGASKAAAEMLVASYNKHIDTMVVRAQNIYGPLQYPSKIIPKFILLLQRGYKLPLHGTGQEKKYYIFIADAASAINTILHCASPGGIYNLSSPDSYTSFELCEMLLSLVQPPGWTGLVEDWLQRTPARDVGKPPDAVNNNRLCKLGWARKVEMKEGLERSVEWYMKYGGEWWGNIEKDLEPVKK